jgi:hypothetical protein
MADRRDHRILGGVCYFEPADMLVATPDASAAATKGVMDIKNAASAKGPLPAEIVDVEKCPEGFDPQKEHIAAFAPNIRSKGLKFKP